MRTLSAAGITVLAAILTAAAPAQSPRNPAQTAPASQSAPNPEPAPAACNTAKTPQNPPSSPASKKPGLTCVSSEEAAKEPNKEVCVTAHVYDVVEIQDGTRFLDICPAQVADDQCRFTLLSMAWDREDVGDLRRYRDQDVKVRGIVRLTHGRMGIVISHVRQFNGGPEKFRPNPKLLSGFNAQSDRRAVRDPNLAPSGRHRSFMNSAEKVPTRAR